MDLRGRLLLSTGQPSYHPAVLLKLYIDGYLGRWEHEDVLEAMQRRLDGSPVSHYDATVGF